MPKVKFEINAWRELEYLKKYVEECGDSGIEKDAKKLLEMDQDSALRVLEQKYDNESLGFFRQQMEKLWWEIEGVYFERVEEITKHKFEQEEIVCYITMYIPGFADIWEHSGVYLGKALKADLVVKRYLLAHEIIHLHYSKIILEEKYDDVVKKPMLNESVPILIMLLDEQLKNFWDFVTLDNVRKSYPGVDENLDDLKALWEEKKNFKKFMKEAVKKYGVKEDDTS